MPQRQAEVPVPGDVMIKIEDLPMLALMKRAAAQSVFNKDKDEYERLEDEADQLYAMAEENGLDFFEVPRFSEIRKPKRTKPCEQCGKDFQYQRKTARFCSKSCRQKYAYYEEEAA